MIKLIASDIDGTLVKDSAKEVYPELIEMFQKLLDQGKIVTVASGRQFYSIKRMFRELDDQIVYIAENGAFISYEGKTLSVIPMEWETVQKIIRDLRKLPQDCHILVCCPEGAYMETEDEFFYDLMANSYCNKIDRISDVLEQQRTVIKISAFRKDGMREIAESGLIEKWEDIVKVCMAGEQWVDFMDFSVDKGNALKEVQKLFGITKEETMAFGDNNNDVGLLMQAGESYAVENAVLETKAVAKYSCPTYQEKGVYQILYNAFKD